MTTEELEARVVALEARLSDREPEALKILPDVPYKVLEVAQRLRCAHTNVYALIDSKELAHIHVGALKGKGIRVMGSDLIAFMKARKVGGPEPKMAYTRLGM